MRFLKLVTPLALAAAFVTPLNPVDLTLGAPVAYAKDKGGSGHNAGGKGQGNSASSLHSNGNGRGGIASELRWRNSAHANEQALLNAAKNSRVGIIATYRDTTLTARTLGDELNGLGILPENYDPATLPTQEQLDEYLEILDEDSPTYDSDIADTLIVSLGFTSLADIDDAIEQVENTKLLVEYFDAVEDQEAATDAVMPPDGLSDAALAEFHRLLGL